jgi:hypothetical protein
MQVCKLIFVLAAFVAGSAMGDAVSITMPVRLQDTAPIALNDLG